MKHHSIHVSYVICMLMMLSLAAWAGYGNWTLPSFNGENGET